METEWGNDGRLAPKLILSPFFFSFLFFGELSTSYTLYYQVGNERLHLDVEVQNHTGWVGIGMNGNGGMRGASIIVVRKNGEDWVAEDRHATSYATPAMDENQDVNLETAEDMN
eukprot:6457760-Amphidinium_carterae.1